MSLKTWYVGHTVKRWRKDAMNGKFGAIGRKAWALLDGKKTILWAFVVAAQRAFPDLPIWQFVNAAAGALGWSDLAPAVDPNDLVLWGTLAIALGHRLVKAWKDNPVEVEWKKIGEVPEVKDLSQAPEAPALKVIKPDFELVEIRSREVVPVGNPVQISDGRKGIIMLTKESSSTGYTYVVRVEKK